MIKVAHLWRLPQENLKLNTSEAGKCLQSHVADVVVRSHTVQVSLGSRHHKPEHVAACRNHSRVSGAVEAEGGKYGEAGHLEM